MQIVAPAIICLTQPLLTPFGEITWRRLMGSRQLKDRCAFTPDKNVDRYQEQQVMGVAVEKDDIVAYPSRLNVLGAEVAVDILCKFSPKLVIYGNVDVMGILAKKLVPYPAPSAS